MNKYDESFEWLEKVFISYLRTAYPKSTKIDTTKKAINNIKELVECATPKGVITKTTSTRCPNCGFEFGIYEYNHCPDCGQALDWSDA